MPNANFAIAPAETELEIGDFAVSPQQTLPPFAIGRIDIKLPGVGGGQFLGGVISQNAHERIVKIDEPAIRSGNEHALLYVFKEGPKLVLGLATIGDVAKNVDGSQTLAIGIMQRGIGGLEITGKRRIEFFRVARGLFAVRAALPRDIAAAQGITNGAPGKLGGLRLQSHGKSAIHLENLALEVVNEDEVVDRIERILP